MTQHFCVTLEQGKTFAKPPESEASVFLETASHLVPSLEILQAWATSTMNQVLLCDKEMNTILPSPLLQGLALQ